MLCSSTTIKSSGFNVLFSKSFYQPATYNDYEADIFPVITKNGFSIKTFKGEGAPLEMQTPGINIQEITFSSGSHKLELENDQIHSMYLMDGDMLLENGTLNPDDFIVVD